MDVRSISPKLEQVPSAWSISSLVMQRSEGEGILEDGSGELLFSKQWSVVSLREKCCCSPEVVATEK